MSKSPAYEELVIVVNQLQQRVSELEGLPPVLQQLKEKNDLLEKQSDLLEKRNDQLEKKAELLEEKAELLQRENDILKDKLAKYENPKNSNNSSVPPSKDENRPFKSKSLRKKTGRKPGGQKGHEGTTLKMVSDPNEIIDHAPEYCECCGKDIVSIPGEFVERK
ncbi:unnamed protein product, partial [marine sediment metagenome]